MNAAQSARMCAPACMITCDDLAQVACGVYVVTTCFSNNGMTTWEKVIWKMQITAVDTLCARVASEQALWTMADCGNAALAAAKRKADIRL